MRGDQLQARDGFYNLSVTAELWETDYFEPNWRDSFWGDNHPRLRAIKQRYDPEGLFFLHHGVGSEDWSADGFTRVK